MAAPPVCTDTAWSSHSRGAQLRGEGVASLPSHSRAALLSHPGLAVPPLVSLVPARLLLSQHVPTSASLAQRCSCKMGKHERGSRDELPRTSEAQIQVFQGTRVGGHRQTLALLLPVRATTLRQLLEAALNRNMPGWVWRCRSSNPGSAAKEGWQGRTMYALLVQRKAAVSRSLGSPHG